MGALYLGMVVMASPEEHAAYRKAEKENKRLAAQAEYLQKCTWALELKIEGKSDREIAATVGWANPVSVPTAIKRALAQVPSEAAAIYRDIHMARLELLWASLLPAIKMGDPPSVRAAVVVLKREAALLGLDAPVKINLSQIAEMYAQEYGLTELEKRELFMKIREEMNRVEALPPGEVSEAQWRVVGEEVGE